MKTKTRYVLFALAALAAAAVAAYRFLAPGDQPPPTDAASTGVKARRPGPVAKGAQSKAAMRKARAEKRISESSQPREKPVVDVDPDADTELSEEMREVLESIREALEDNTFAKLQKALAKMKKSAMEASGGSGHWLDHVPKRVKLSALSTLGWFGGEAIPELIEFLGDGDADVAEQAMNQFELSLQDFSLGDRGRAEIIKTVSQIVTDKRDLDWILTTALDSRPSVGVETLSFVSANGTPEAREMVGDYIDFFTGGEGLRTASEARRWLELHPDESWAEAFFGPIK